MKFFFRTALPVLVAWFIPAACLADNNIGLPAFRAVTTNLDGSGIRVAQPEADSVNDFEVAPTDVGLPASLFTYTSALGTTNVYPNSVGTYSGHAGGVGQYFYSPTYFGVSTNVVGVDNYEADYFITGLVANLTAIPAAIVNQSFADTTLANQSYYDPLYDNYAAKWGILFITGAGDSAGQPVEPPSTCYNGICVAGYEPFGSTSCIGPTADNGRCKPDITAFSVYTSTSAPQVAGTAAVLMQAALRGDGGSYTNQAFDSRTIKALLLNGAVKPAGWTNSRSSPLDARYGAGVVNILNSYEQLAGRRQTNFVQTTTTTLNGAHLPTGDTNTIGVLSGWDLGTNTSGSTFDAVRHYYFNVSNSVAGTKFTATATLVWNRHLNKTAINNLNLYLYNCTNNNLVNCSTSQVDNVEHIYQTNLPAGRYDLQVWKAGGATVTTGEGYALAFEFMPAPRISITGSGTNLALTWPVYPAGFLVEPSTNLLGAWNTNGFSAPLIITNGVNSIALSPTNTQFFRLRKPNF